MSADDIRRTNLPPIAADGVRRWPTHDDGAPVTPDADSFAAVRRDLNAIAGCLGDFIDRLPDMVERLVATRMKASQNETHALVAEAVARLEGQLKGYLIGIRESLDPSQRTRKVPAEFRFANEAHDASESGGDVPVEPTWRHGKVIVN
jgi:hypothetical protein